jgi:hypothetical protein
MFDKYFSQKMSIVAVREEETIEDDFPVIVDQVLTKIME